MSGSKTWPAGIPSPTDRRVAAVVAAWVEAADTKNPAGAISAVTTRVAEEMAIEVAVEVDGHTAPPSAAVLDVQVDGAVLRDAGPWLLGFTREALVSGRERRQEGVHHTTPAMAAALVEFVGRLRPFVGTDVIVDPSVGGGVFLLAVCDALGGDRAGRLAQVRGIDVDPLAIATAEASLRLWAGGAPLPAGALRVGDALDDDWGFGEVEVVIGNPPFRSQLRDGTGRPGPRREELARRWPELRGYVDDAAAFLLAGVDEVVDGGVVALVQPASVLSARDAEAVRRRLLREAPPVGMWIDGGRQFSASVDTVALVVEKGAEAPAAVARVRGVPTTDLADHPPIERASWASLLLVDSPVLQPGDTVASGTLADVAHVTAGFRDQFYGLRGAVAEEGRDRHPKLITSGLIDPLSCRWGEATCRFDKQRWTKPTVDVDAVDPAARQWVRDRLVPKLLVASQTRIVEVVIDESADMVPCTPVITVEPRADAPSLAHLAAALTSPLASLLLMNDAAGSALSADAMRVSARALGALPLPPLGAEWDAAASAVNALGAAPTTDELDEIAQLSLAAYGMADRLDVLNWWRSRRRDR